MSDIAVPGYPVEQEDLEALALAAGDIGLPPVGQDAYNFNAYEADSVTARRWQTQLRRIFWDVQDKFLALTSPLETVPLSPTAAAISGPWLVPFNHSRMWVFGWDSPVATVYTAGAPNFGRSVVDLKLWSRGVATPLRMMCQVFPSWEFELNGETSAPATSSASWAYTRPAKTAGCFFVSVQVADTTSPSSVDITFSGSPSALDVTEMAGSPQVTWLYDDEDSVSHYSVWRSKRASWGTCLNDGESENRDIFERESGITGDSFTVGYTVTGAGEFDPIYVSYGGSPAMNGFSVSAHYGDSEAYPAAQQAAISEDDWYVTPETPRFMVTHEVLHNGTRYSGYDNVAWMWMEAIPADAEHPPEYWWEAKLWPVAYRTRSRIVNPATGEGDGPTFLGQTHAAGGQTIAVIEAASDGLWCQPSDIAEWSMDGTTRRQPVASLIGGTEACPVFIDWVWVRRRAGVALNTDVEVEIGCWQGEGEAREFVSQVTVTLDSGLTAKKCTLAKILPVFDNQSIGYTNADKVTVRCANWKAIGETDGLRNIGRILPDGTPAGIVTDTQRLIEAIAAL